ncbi:hypothetical protein NDU88_007518 [Pleurodeles waltl]|uniref:Uncharacterized protein n=1 Tax=Pleurodeles waltl TaxID=8319 RepID=A0AAV7PLJ9_PLEWA|nr:hypothetical protein NDU88_007518 [Pleurodeles waltl]
MSSDRVPSSEPKWKYPRGTLQIIDDVPEEAEPQGSGRRQEETEIKGVISPVSHGTRSLTVEEENGGTMASRDGGTRDEDRIMEIRGEERPKEEDGGTEDSCN